MSVSSPGIYMSGVLKLLSYSPLIFPKFLHRASYLANELVGLKLTGKLKEEKLLLGTR